jgi:DNA-binding transcriptional LysR family regulator
VRELGRHFRGLELKFLRGSGLEVAECLKRGDAELGIAAGEDESWERLDRWPLFTERFQVAINAGHKLAGQTEIDVDDLRQQRILVRTHCEHAAQFAGLLSSRDINIAHGHELTCEADVIALLEADFGVAIVPSSASAPRSVIRAQLRGLDLRRTVSLYGVAGRQRTAVAAAAMKMLRAYDWSKYMN